MDSGYKDITKKARLVEDLQYYELTKKKKKFIKYKRGEG